MHFSISILSLVTFHTFIKFYCFNYKLATSGYLHNVSSSCVDVSSIGSFGIGILILLYPIKKLISAARDYMDKSFTIEIKIQTGDSKSSREYVLDKNIKTRKYEIERFSKSVEDMFSNLLNNFKIGLVNGFTNILNFYNLSNTFGVFFISHKDNT